MKTQTSSPISRSPLIRFVNRIFIPDTCENGLGSTNIATFRGWLSGIPAPSVRSAAWQATCRADSLQRFARGPESLCVASHRATGTTGAREWGCRLARTSMVGSKGLATELTVVPGHRSTAQQTIIIVIRLSESSILRKKHPASFKVFPPCSILTST